VSIFAFLGGVRGQDRLACAAVQEISHPCKPQLKLMVGNVCFQVKKNSEKLIFSKNRRRPAAFAAAAGRAITR
jgi:hypothetical protein